MFPIVFVLHTEMAKGYPLESIICWTNHITEKQSSWISLDSGIYIIVVSISYWTDDSTTMQVLWEKIYQLTTLTPKNLEGFPYPNLLNLVSFDELNHTDQKSTSSNGFAGHSTKIHHNKMYKKVFTLQFPTWICKFSIQSSLLSFPLAAVTYHLMCNSLVILINTRSM